jgi:hypothetical protein
MCKKNEGLHTGMRYSQQLWCPLKKRTKQHNIKRGRKEPMQVIWCRMTKFMMEATWSAGIVLGLGPNIGFELVLGWERILSPVC